MVLAKCRRLGRCVVLGAGAIILAAGLVTDASAAETYPTKPIRMVVPFPPGGGTDLVTRAVTPKLSQSVGQSFVIDNRGGANSNIGTDTVAKAPADGYTLLMATANLAINVSLYPRLPFDLVKDFSPVTVLAASAFVLTTHPSVGAANVSELIAIAKSGRLLNYASNGSGSPAHIAAEMFK